MGWEIDDYGVKLRYNKKAQNNIKTVVRKTPLFYSSTFSRKTGYEVYLKCENKQKTGAFKLRGAYNKIVSLAEEERKRGHCIFSRKPCSRCCLCSYRLWNKIYYSYA